MEGEFGQVSLQIGSIGGSGKVSGSFLQSEYFTALGVAQTSVPCVPHLLQNDILKRKSIWF